jgi:hypothetical protein
LIFQFETRVDGPAPPIHRLQKGFGWSLRVVAGTSLASVRDDAKRLRLGLAKPIDPRLQHIFPTSTQTAAPGFAE